MQPLFGFEETDEPRITVATLRVVCRPDGHPTWYEVSERNSKGDYQFWRFNTSAGDWPDDPGFDTALATMRRVIAERMEANSAL